MARSCQLFSSRWPPRYLLVAGPRTFPGLGMSGIVAVIFFFFDAVRGFNVDTARPEIFASADGARLGERVVQFGQGMDGWLGVSGQDVEGAGALYRCMLGNQTCAAISLAGMMNVSAQLSIGSSGRDVVVCDPTAVQHCLHNSWVPGFCFRYTDFPHEGRKLDVKEKECIAELVDVVFLFDGSNSLSKRDLKKNKDFMLNMMQQADDNMQFAVVQYSMKTKIEMDFNTFQKNRHRLSEIMAQIELMESATFTATGINVTLNHVFTEEAGSRHGSSQLLIVITDGAISNGDLNLTHVIRRAEERGITRCAIGVGSAFTNGSQALRELQTIASSPAYLIQVKNYNELNSIFNDLKTKMYKIEGTQSSSNETSFELEMAQMGFSVLLTEVRPPSPRQCPGVESGALALRHLLSNKHSAFA
ncbi:integrin alpha-M-like [Narcine bancroftii]|uniref:integrin alpha-M-like n=1 Tax=Narcine bancroftii TaxID=1343680 RepID=UPI0038312AD0